MPPRERCPVYVGPDQWPRFHGGKKGKLVVTLVGALGNHCHACGDVTGSFIDHDHFTGYVRGLLCKGCNHIVDMCPHPSGCIYAGYLNDPPASLLRLKYSMDRTLKERRKRMAALGISSFDELWTRRRQRYVGQGEPGSMPVFACGTCARVLDGQRVGFSGEGGEGGRHLGQAGPDVGGHGAHRA